MQLRLMSCLTLLAGSLAIGTVVLPVDAVAAAAPDPSALVIAMSSTWTPAQRGEPVTIDGHGDTTGVGSMTTSGIEVGGQHSGQPAVTIRIAPPPGQTLHPGHYATSAQSVPGAALFLLTIGSVTESGAVPSDMDVRDLRYDTNGSISRVDIVFRRGTTMAANAYFGELQWNEPSDASGMISSSRSVMWPAAPVGSTPVRSTQRLHNTTATTQTVGQIGAVGEMAADFRVLDDTCSGNSLAVGGSCTYDVAFSGNAPGLRAARLTVSTSAGELRIELTATADVGQNGFRVSTPRGVARYADGRYQIGGSGTPHTTSFAVTQVYGTDLDTVISFEIPQSARFTPGVHRAGSQPGSNVTWFVRGHVGTVDCAQATGTITVADVVQDGQGRLVAADVSWKLACGSTPTDGHVLYRYRADLVGPGAVSVIHVNPPGTAGRALAWTNPSGDFARTIVRLVPGWVPAEPVDTGILVTAGRVSRAVLPPLWAGHPYSLLFFTIDVTGNVTPAGRVSVTG